MTRARVPAGVTEGGQFTAGARAEAALTLGAPVRVPAEVPVSPAAVRALEAIEAAGGRGYLVGGCVRDSLLRPGAAPKDVDIEAYGLEPGDLARALDGVGRVDEVGKAFSVLTVRTGGQSLDVALPRREVRTGPGHRDFAIEVDPYVDLATASGRRDFTINALMFDPATGELVDCWGGLEDLRAGVLRHTTPAFAEDPLRVLRGARFAARFDLTMHPDTAALARDLAPEFASLSTERVWGEWSTMAATAKHPSRWLDVLEETGWLRHFPEVDVLRGIPQDRRWHPEGDVYEHSRLAADAGARLADEAGLRGPDRAAIVLAAMLHDVGKATHTQHDGDRITAHGHDEFGEPIAKAFLSRIGAPRHVADLVGPLVRNHMASTTVADPSLSAVRRLARRLAPATMHQWALVVGADRGGRGSASEPGNTGRWMELAQRAGTEQRPVRPILGGQILRDAGWAPGPSFGPVIKAAIAAQDDGAFTDADGARAWLATTYPDGQPGT